MDLRKTFIISVPAVFWYFMVQGYIYAWEWPFDKTPDKPIGEQITPSQEKVIVDQDGEESKQEDSSQEGNEQTTSIYQGVWLR